MNITLAPVVSFDEITKKFDFCHGDVNFTQMAENGSYVCFDLSTDAIEEREEELKDFEGKFFYEKYISRIANELTLINYFRELGYTDYILISIFW